MFLSRKLLSLGIFLVFFLGLSAVLIQSQLRKKSHQTSESGVLQAQPDSKVFAAYATSRNCKSCHAEIFKLWESSHHARAERLVRSDLDSSAFDPPNEINLGSQHSSVSLSNGVFQIKMAGTNPTHQTFAPG